MFDIDLILFFFFMALLFLRQVYILKQSNKINYAPLMLGIGGISSVIHFVINPENTDLILLLRESFFPFLVALLLFLIMNIMHQTQESENAKIQEKFIRVLVSQITELKVFISELENRMIVSQQEDLKTQEEVRAKFKEDVKALDVIQSNQSQFSAKFDSVEQWHSEVSKKFQHFTNEQMPELDNIVHKHIDILRVSEQEHYKKIKVTLDSAVESKLEMSDDIKELKESIGGMKNMTEDISKSITSHTLQQLSGITKAFEEQIIALKSHSEGVKTSLYEGENRLSSIRKQSEMIMKQMLLSSNKMNELEEQNSNLYDVFGSMKELINEVENVKSGYLKSQIELNTILKEMKSSEQEHIDSLQLYLEKLGSDLDKKIDDSLEKLHEHYHIANEDITDSVKILAKKAQSQKGYSQ